MPGMNDALSYIIFVSLSSGSLYLPYSVRAKWQQHSQGMASCPTFVARAQALMDLAWKQCKREGKVLPMNGLSLGTLTADVNLP